MKAIQYALTSVVVCVGLALPALAHDGPHEDHDGYNRRRGERSRSYMDERYRRDRGRYGHHRGERNRSYMDESYRQDRDGDGHRRGQRSRFYMDESYRDSNGQEFRDERHARRDGWERPRERDREQHRRGHRGQ